MRRLRWVAPLAATAILAAGCVSATPPSQHTPKSDYRKSDYRKSDCRISGCPRARPGDAPGVGVWHRFGVGSRWMTFTEPAYTAIDGSPVAARRLLVQVRTPRRRGSAKGLFPMIVFAPGFMQCGRPYADLLDSWAKAGYVVVVVNFPGSDCLVPNPTEDDMLNQPRDMSFVITRMLALSRAKHGPFSRLLNPRQIAIAGHSDGGDTVAAVTLNSCCTDHRVKAVAVESGAKWPKMRGSYFAGPAVPVLFSQGSADTINPAGCSVYLYYGDRSRPRFYLDLFGASHTGPYWGTSRIERLVARVTLAFFDRYVLRRAAAGAAMRRQGNVGGLAALFSNGRGDLPPAIPGPPCY